MALNHFLFCCPPSWSAAHHMVRVTEDNEQPTTQPRVTLPWLAPASCSRTDLTTFIADEPYAEVLMRFHFRFFTGRLHVTEPWPSWWWHFSMHLEEVEHCELLFGISRNFMVLDRLSLVPTAAVRPSRVEAVATRCARIA